MTTLTELANDVKEHLKLDYDAVIAIEGYPGCGKTSLAIQLGMLLDDTFDLEKNVVYLPDADELKNKFNSLPKYSCFLIDEAAKVLYKLRWMEKVQQTINEMYMTERKQNKCTIMCIPRFKDLNDHFRNFKVKIRIWIVERGIGIVYINDIDIDADDPWHSQSGKNLKYSMWYSRGKKVADISSDERIRVESMKVNYIGMIAFKECEPKIWEKYKERHDFYKQRELSGEVSSGLVSERRYKDSVENAIGIIYNQRKDAGDKVTDIILDLQKMFKYKSERSIYNTVKRYNENKDKYEKNFI